MIEVMDERDTLLTHFTRFERTATNDPAGWFLPIRKAAFAHFAELGFPTTDDEEWRFTNVNALAATRFESPHAVSCKVSAEQLSALLFDAPAQTRLVFVNGRYAPSLSVGKPVSDVVRVASLSASLVGSRSVLETHLARHAAYDTESFTALNTALWEDGALVYISRRTAVEAPIHIVHVTTTPGPVPAPALAVHPRNLIVLEESSQATVVETYIGLGSAPCFTNAVTELVAGDNAVLDHYKLVREGESAYHIGRTQIHQYRSANVSSHTITLDGGLVRNDIHVVLDGEGGDCTLNGLYMLNDAQHVDNHLIVEHAKPHCFSREFFKGILDGKSKGIFSGRIIVRKGAQKTDAKQTNRSLLLSADAQVESRPQLEIFADDVKCTHGATIGQVNADALFYLRSRGLSAEAARSLLVHAFARESIALVKLEPLRRHLDELLVSRLPGGELFREVLR